MTHTCTKPTKRLFHKIYAAYNSHLEQLRIQNVYWGRNQHSVHQLSHSPQMALLPFQADKGLWGPGTLYRVSLSNSNLHILCFSRTKTQQVEDHILVVSQDNVSLWKGETHALGLFTVTFGHCKARTNIYFHKYTSPHSQFQRTRYWIKCKPSLNLGTKSANQRWAYWEMYLNNWTEFN